MTVEEYVVSKDWNYEDVGTDFKVETCPFCLRDHWTFFIHHDPDTRDSKGRPKQWLYECKRLNCAQRGNQITLFKHMGDLALLPQKEKYVQGVSTKKEKYVENISESQINKAHENLRNDTELVAYLMENFGWSFDLIDKFKIGFDYRKVELEDVRDENNKKVREILPCIWYPYTEKGKTAFFKCRTAPGNPRGFGAPAGHDVPLYNDAAIKDDMEYVVFVEGEKDTLSALSLIGEDVVVGIPGAGLNKVSWAEKIMKPKKRFLLFDNDEAGQIGAEKFINRFGIGKFINVVLPAFITYDDAGNEFEGKDITDWIRAGHTKGELLELFAEAERKNRLVGPVSTKNVSDAMIDEWMSDDGERPYDSPWADFNDRLGGASDGQIIHVIAEQKIGKTTFAMNWLEYLTSKGYNTLLRCLEMPTKDIIRKWASHVLRVSDAVPKKGEKRLFTKAHMIQAFDEIANPRDSEFIVFGNEYEAMKGIEEEMAFMEAVIRQDNIKVWVYDNIQFLADTLLPHAKSGTSVYQMINLISKEYKKLAARTNTLGIILIQSNDTGEDGIASVSTSANSRAIKADCDYSVVLNRTKTVLAKSQEELEKMGDVQTTGIFGPKMYITVGLSRFTQGGSCTTWIEGDKSTIRDLLPEEREATRQVSQEQREKGNSNDAVVQQVRRKALLDAQKWSSQEDGQSEQVRSETTDAIVASIASDGSEHVDLQP